MASVLTGLPRYWQGVDDTTPVGCTMFLTKVVGILTTYVLRDGEVIGRVEHPEGTPSCGYVGAQLKGGSLVGRGDVTELAQKIADRAARAD